MNNTTTCTPNERPHAERLTMFNDVEKLIRKIVHEEAAHLKPFMDTEDVLQECLMDVWTVTGRLDKYDATKARWTTYVGACVRRKIRGLHHDHTTSKIRVNGGSEMQAEYHAARANDDDTADDADEVPTVGQHDTAAIATEAGNAALHYLANPDANPLKPIFEALYQNEVPIFMLVAVEGLSAVEAAERLGWKLSIVEIAVRAIVKRLQERGLLSPELLEKYRRWKEKDALNPVRGSDPTVKKCTEKTRAKRQAKTSAWREQRAQQRAAKEQRAADMAARKAEREARKAEKDRVKQLAHADA